MPDLIEKLARIQKGAVTCNNDRNFDARSATQSTAQVTQTQGYLLGVSWCVVCAGERLSVARDAAYRGVALGDA